MTEWQNCGMAEWWNGNRMAEMVEWQNSGIAEWWNGGMVIEWRKWWNGGIAEWRNGGMAVRQKEWQNGRMAEMALIAIIYPFLRQICFPFPSYSKLRYRFLLYLISNNAII